jgi:hypothetical protein
MPCYEVRTVSVEFKVGNIEILKRALEKMNVQIVRQDENGITFNQAYNQFTISFLNSKINSNVDEKELTSISNSIKRAYSEVVIDEVAKKQRWIKKQMGAGRYQLQRF